jgi:hypothetical protein
MGFALESFDPIGRWRDTYPKVDLKAHQGVPIDTSATLPSGREIKDITEFKAMLLEREEQVVRCLAEKMLTYATGRLMEAGDRGEIDRIVHALEDNDYRLRELVHLVVKSNVFLNN